MKVYVINEKGTGKRVSEDRALIGESIYKCGSLWVDLPDGNVMIALADGVGGNAGGAEASQYVLEQLCAKVIPDKGFSDTQLRELLDEINCQLIAVAGLSPEMKHMATTLTGIYCHGSDAYYFHVGNTRLYTVQGSYLRQVTDDHTTREWLHRTGQSEAAANCPSNEITACLGGGSPDLAKALQIAPINKWNEIRGWVLTSDGIHDYVNDDEIDLLSCDITQIEDIANHVLQDAVDNGSCDDKSIIVIRRKE